MNYPKNLNSKFFLLLSLLSLSASATQGYWVNKDGQIWRNASGACWKSRDWEPSLAIAECDPEIARANARIDAAPAAEAPAEAQTLNSDFGSPARFELNEAEIRNADARHLNAVASEVKDIPADKTLVIEGHADRTGDADFNRDLSRRRAEEARGYLISRGVAAERIEVEAKGSASPVTTQSACSGKSGDALADCLQPDRRIDVYLR